MAMDQEAENLDRARTQRQGHENTALILSEKDTTRSVEAELCE
jgi:hypothetical protein